MGKLIDIINEIVAFGELNTTGLAKLINKLHERDFAIISAWNGKYTRTDNNIRQRKVHSMLKSLMNIGGYRLVGYWRETPDRLDYNKAGPDDLKDEMEDSVLFIRPENVSREKFIDRALFICKEFDQNTVIVGLNEEEKHKYIPTIDKPDNQFKYAPNMNVYLYNQDGDRVKVGNKLSFKKIAQAYSKMRGREDVPFVFEGLLHPTSNMSRQFFKVNNVLYDRETHQRK